MQTKALDSTELAQSCLILSNVNTSWMTLCILFLHRATGKPKYVKIGYISRGYMSVKAVYGPKPSSVYCFLHCPFWLVGPCEAGSTAPKHTDTTPGNFCLATTAEYLITAPKYSFFSQTREPSSSLADPMYFQAGHRTSHVREKSSENSDKQEISGFVWENATCLGYWWIVTIFIKNGCNFS